jgi:hypothetical protein
VLRHEIAHAEETLENETRCELCGRGPERSHSKCREYEPERDKYGL